MATLFTYARSIETDEPLFAIVADDSSVEYVWAKDDQPWWENFEARRPFITGPDEPAPTEASGWIEQASRHLGPEIIMDAPFDDASNPKQATRLAQDYLDELFEQRTSPEHPALPSNREAWDTVTESYPNFGDLDESLLENPSAMDNLVLMSLGSIDEDGPNGWILRAQDGTPAEGDENEYVHFPGTMSSEEDESEEDSE